MKAYSAMYVSHFLLFHSKIKQIMEFVTNNMLGKKRVKFIEVMNKSSTPAAFYERAFAFYGKGEYTKKGSNSSLPSNDLSRPFC